MSRWVGKVEQQAASSLRRSEKVVAATFAQASGSLWTQAIGGGVGAGVGIVFLTGPLGSLFAAGLGAGLGATAGLILITKLASRRSGGGSTGTAGSATLASQVPTGRVMFALTNRRMLFFAMSPYTNTPKQLLLELKLKDAPKVTVNGANRFIGSMTFTFSDNSIAKTEIVKASKAQAFVDAANAATATD